MSNIILKWGRAHLFVTQLNSFKYRNLTLVIVFSICGFKSSKWFSSSIWPIDEIATGATTPGQSGPVSNSNEEVIHISCLSRTGALPSDAS